MNDTLRMDFLMLLLHLFVIFTNFSFCNIVLNIGGKMKVNDTIGMDFFPFTHLIVHFFHFNFHSILDGIRENNVDIKLDLRRTEYLRNTLAMSAIAVFSVERLHTNPVSMAICSCRPTMSITRALL